MIEPRLNIEGLTGIFGRYTNATSSSLSMADVGFIGRPCHAFLVEKLEMEGILRMAEDG